MPLLPTEGENLDPQGPGRGPWRPSDPRQIETHRRLRLFGDAPADHFLDACELMEKDVFRATTHLVAHSLRELDGGIRAVLVAGLEDEQLARIGVAERKHKAEIDEVTRLLFGADGEQIASDWWRYASRLHELTHRHSLRAPRPVDDAFRDWFALGQAVNHRISRQYETVYVEALPRIDELAAKEEPTAADLTALRERVPHSAVALDRFFAAATAGWFPLLRDAGYFADPPPLHPDDEGRVAFVPWPPGQYLVHLADDEERRPDAVALALALDTDNPEAQQAVVDIALACPPELAAELAPKVSEFLGTPFQWRLPFKARDLVAHLMAGGQSAAALGLLPALISPSGRQSDTWRSTSLLGELIPNLFPAADLTGVAALADLLDADLDADEHTRARDHSYIWRPTLEGGRRGDFRDTLISALRDGAAAIVADDDGRLAEVVEVLETRPRSIFRRLALDLLRRFPEDGLVADRLGDRERFDDINLEREYDLLIRERFSDLPDEIGQRVLTWIEEGPAPGDGEDEAGRRERWQLRQLVRLGEDLPDEWRERRDALADAHGPPPELPPRRAVWSGASAPLEREALEALTVPEVVAYLQTWSPENGFGGPSREGLARLLEEVVAADPARFAAEAAAFADVQPAYAHALISGLRTALSNADEGADAPFEWPRVLEFTRLALEQPRILPGRTEDDLGEPDAGWIGTRTDIARLLQVALGRRQVPADLSPELVAIIEALLDDPHPDRDYEQRWHGEGTDAPLLALNSVRGAALHALMQYAWWLRRQTDEGEEPRLDQRVRELLERHLDPASEETEAIHSVYGEWFPFLVDLDQPWAAAHVEQIFPLAGEQQRRGQVAWDSYVAHNRAWPDTFALLGAQYEAAIERFVAAEVEDGHDAEDRRDALLGHLVGLYVQGAVTVDDAVFGRFLEAAPLAPRARLLELIGHDLASAEGQVPETTTTRLRALWESRAEAVAAAVEAGDSGAVNELDAFSWWFAAGVFDDAWALGRLEAMLMLGGVPEQDHVAIERLVALQDQHLVAVIHILALLIDNVSDPWFVLGSRDEVRTLLRAGLASEDGPVRDEARAATSRLVARGHPGFADLLE